MRLLATLKDENAAVRFAAWLMTQKIEAHAEVEQEGWSVWVRDEDQLKAAKEHLAVYQADPENPRYRSAVQQAAALEREELQKRERSQKNTIEMSRNWSAGPGGITTPQSKPLVLAFLAVSVLVFVLTDWGEQRGPGLRAGLQFCSGIKEFKGDRGQLTYVWKDILAGEVWRFVTPMFLHFSVMHLIFNLMVMYDFGGQIENRLKGLWFGLLVIAIAIFAHAAQATLDSIQWEDGTLHWFPYFPKAGNFGGMSGVNYGLFGFIFVRTRWLRDSSYFMGQQTSVIMFIWLVFCIARNFFPANFGGDMPYVANVAHVAGLLAGMALAFARKPGA